MYRYRYRNSPWLVRVFVKLATWLIGSFIVAVLLGSVVWFIGRMFGAEWVYWTYIRGWFIFALIVDAIIDLWNYATEDFGHDKY
jgi:hypothetical protein